jgi:L-alanine-DL-glutamate epimerase-like enolase superfamily enzyme
MIDAVSVVGEDIPYAREFPTSYGEKRPSEHVFVRVEADGTSGVGEGSALRHFTGETTRTMVHAVADVFAPLVVGRSVDEALADFRSEADRLPGHPTAKTALEMALLDLKARGLGVPLAELLGVPRREELSTVFLAGARPANVVADDVAAAFDAGYRTFKVKADGRPSTDAERLNAVVDFLRDVAAPDAVTVRVDANTGWETAERTRQAIERIDHREYLEYVEQPVAAGATGDLRALRAGLDVPVFADEAVHGLADLRDLLAEPAAVSGACLKLAKTGSLLEFRAMGTLAAASGVPVSVVSAFDASVGMAANLHLAAVLPRLTSAVELCADMLVEDPATDPIAVEPRVAVPDGPGLGVDLDETLFERGRSVTAGE